MQSPLFVLSLIRPSRYRGRVNGVNKLVKGDPPNGKPITGLSVGKSNFLLVLDRWCWGSWRLRSAADLCPMNDRANHPPNNWRNKVVPANNTAPENSTWIIPPRRQYPRAVSAIRLGIRKVTKPEVDWIANEAFFEVIWRCMVIYCWRRLCKVLPGRALNASCHFISFSCLFNTSKVANHIDIDRKVS